MSETSTIERMPTGITGLDQALAGGLPRGRTTLLVGSTGSGKTIFTLQALAQGARLGESGVLLTFEEDPKDAVANMAGFSWAPFARAGARLAVMDCREVRAAFRNGSFDLAGLLSAIEHRCRSIKARRLAIDGIDVLLDMIDDTATMRREVYRLSDWLSERALTTIITVKGSLTDGPPLGRYAFLPSLTECVLVLEHQIAGRMAQRSLRVLKCRGVAHSSNEMPLVVSSSGLEVDPPRPEEMAHRVFSERVSTGVLRLDTMLDGGYLRGTCTLISGGPGTSKTSLAGAFAEAACARGERTLFVSFDESSQAILRNLASVNIRLGRFLRSGLLRLFSVQASGQPPEAHTLRIGSLLLEHEARCLVVDPASSLVHEGDVNFAYDAVLGLLDLAKRRGITVLMTSLVDDASAVSESTAIGISTIADTWMRLSYLAAGGERNRGLTIVKSRGTAHSNQVRELILTSQGLSLVDVYTAGGAVLMGALRRQKEEEERAEHTRVLRVEQARREEILSALAVTQAQIASLRADEQRKKTDLRLLKESSRAGATVGAANLATLRRLRHADVAPGRALKPSARRRK